MTKKLTIVVLIILSVCNIASLRADDKNQGVKFETGTFEEILKKAKADKNGPKYIFVDCYTKWCGPCKMVASKIFPTKEAGDYFNKNFVNVKMDMETPEGKLFNQKYKITAYPTFIVMDLNGKEINRNVGVEIDIKWLINKIESLKDYTKSASYLKEKFESTQLAEDAVNYLNALYKVSRFNRDITPFLENNIHLIQPRTIFSFDFWKFIDTALSIFGKSKKIANIVVKNKEYAAFGVGSETVREALCDFYIGQLQSYMTGKNDITTTEADIYANNVRLLMNDFDMYASTMCELYECRKNNDTEGEIKIMKGRYIHSIKESNYVISIIEVLKKNPNIPQEVWDEYAKSIESYYDSSKKYEISFINKN